MSDESADIDLGVECENLQQKIQAMASELRLEVSGLLQEFDDRYPAIEYCADILISLESMNAWLKERKIGSQ